MKKRVTPDDVRSKVWSLFYPSRILKWLEEIGVYPSEYVVGYTMYGGVSTSLALTAGGSHLGLKTINGDIEFTNTAIMPFVYVDEKEAEANNEVFFKELARIINKKGLADKFYKS